MRLRRTYNAQIGCHIAEVDSVPTEQLAQIAAVNYRKRVEPIDAREDSFRFNVRQPARWNREFLVTIFFRNARTGTLDVAHSQTKFLAQGPKALSRREHWKSSNLSGGNHIKDTVRWDATWANYCFPPRRYKIGIVLRLCTRCDF